MNKIILLKLSFLFSFSFLGVISSQATEENKESGPSVRSITASPSLTKEAAIPLSTEKEAKNEAGRLPLTLTAIKIGGFRFPR